jgi:hypothetical protein
MESWAQGGDLLFNAIVVHAKRESRRSARAKVDHRTENHVILGKCATTF